VFDSEIHANSGQVLLGEDLFGLASQQRGLAHSAVTGEDYLQKHLMGLGHGRKMIIFSNDQF
jgi:hypothetical protein